MPTLLTRLDFTPRAPPACPQGPAPPWPNSSCAGAPMTRPRPCSTSGPTTASCTTFDLRPRAFSGLGRRDEALAAMAQRLEQKDSVSVATTGAADADRRRRRPAPWPSPGPHRAVSVQRPALVAHGRCTLAARRARRGRVCLLRASHAGPQQPPAGHGAGTRGAGPARPGHSHGVCRPRPRRRRRRVPGQRRPDSTPSRDLFVALDEQNHLVDVEQQIQERFEAELADLLAQLDGPAAPALAQAGHRQGQRPPFQPPPRLGLRPLPRPSL